MSFTQQRGDWLIRPYAPSDREAVRALAAEATWLAGDVHRAIPDGELWAEASTRYFTDREPDNADVVAHAKDGRLGGYLLGAKNILAWEKLLLTLAPRLAFRTITSGLLLRGESRRAFTSIAASALRGELVVPPRVQADFPGTFRFAIRDEARGQGIGAVLVTRCLDRLRERSVRGVHAQSLGIEGELARFLQRAGFQLAASWPIHAWKHVEPAPIDLLTWVLPL